MVGSEFTSSLNAHEKKKEKKKRLSPEETQWIFGLCSVCLCIQRFIYFSAHFIFVNTGKRNVALFSVLPTYLAFNLFSSHTRRSVAMILPSFTCITPQTADIHVGLNVGDLSIHKYSRILLFGNIICITTKHSSKTPLPDHQRNTKCEMRLFTKLKKTSTSIFFWNTFADHERSIARFPFFIENLLFLGHDRFYSFVWCNKSVISKKNECLFFMTVFSSLKRGFRNGQDRRVFRIKPGSLLCFDNAMG